MAPSLLESFDRLVIELFGPFCRNAGLLLRKLDDGIFEIEGKLFAVRLRRSVRHYFDILATILPIKEANGNLEDLNAEIGLGVLAEYCGRPLPVREIVSEQDLVSALTDILEVADRFCLPYLLGEKLDISDVKRFIERKIAASGVETKKYSLPKKVREEWL